MAPWLGSRIPFCVWLQQPGPSQQGPNLICVAFRKMLLNDARTERLQKGLFSRGGSGRRHSERVGTVRAMTRVGCVLGLDAHLCKMGRSYK